MSGWPAGLRFRPIVSTLTRGERVHNAACRALQVLAVILFAAGFFADYRSPSQVTLHLAGIALLFVSYRMGRWVEDEHDE